MFKFLYKKLSIVHKGYSTKRYISDLSELDLSKFDNP